ncbi:hypothetical protein Gotri_018039 [Gossypium trilobum]|uniref:Uncharacterized protein n=1 Tax=Gossypium trilobum TaxID=34281 RepID=A0A7J9E8C6_9ROSI|nr:hypothetical protein [Gossypium trilobum]
MDWRKLFVANKDQSLQYFPPLNNNGSTMVAPPPEVFGAGVQVLQFSLVAQFLDKSPNFSLQRKTVKLLWAKFEATREARDWVLDHGPWALYIGIGLSYVARAIGVPLYMYTITVGQSRLAYAKVCVEIDANQINPRTIDIVLKDDSTGTVG